MNYLSLFSGIEAATAAWHSLGWNCIAVAEIEPFPCSVLAHHYPHVPNLGDVTQVSEADVALLGPIDLVVFGSPCQDLSVAGKRKGFEDGTRSSLFFTAMRIIGWAREHCGCRFALWENVPGAFSSNEGRDFAAVVERLAGIDGVDVPTHGWGSEGAALGDAGLVEWSTLDAQWFGVAQRRRRVFALADFGDWTRRPPILLEPDSMRGDSAPRRGTGEDVAGALATRIDRGGVNSEGTDGHLVASTGDVAHCLNAGGMNRFDYETEAMVVHSLRAEGFDASEDGTGRGTPLVPAVAFQPSQSGVRVDDVHATLDSNNGSRRHNGAVLGSAVRRLTPRECERLQGFPDDYTLAPHRGKPAAAAADGPRYKALGNSMAVPVMHWIGKRLQLALDCESIL